MSVKKLLCWSLAVLLSIGLLPLAVAAAETPLQLALRVLEEPRVGENFTVELMCTGNPGLLSAQFTVSYDMDVLDCIACEKGEVLADMIAATNPDSQKGAIIVAGGAAPAQGDGVLAAFTFAVLKDGDCGFALRDAMFADGSGTKLTFTVAGADVSVEMPTQAESTAQAPTKTEEPDEDAQIPSVTESKSDSDEKTPTEEKKESVVLTDIDGHWAEEYLLLGIKRKLLQGYPDGTCRPNEAVTRAQFVTFLWRSVGEPAPAAETSFTDIQKSSYYYTAVAWAEEQGYVLGVGNNQFLPDDPVSREEVALFLWRAAGGASGAELLFAATYDRHFADSGEISDWAKAAVYWAVYREIWCGVGAVRAGDTLGAKADASRAEIVVMMVNYQDKIGE